MTEEVAQEKREYRGEVFLKFKTGEQELVTRKTNEGLKTNLEPKYGNWAYGGEFPVKVSSLEEALKTIESQAQTKYPHAFVHVDKVYRGREKEPIYITAWDEIGPLASAGSEKKLLNLSY